MIEVQPRQKSHQIITEVLVRPPTIKLQVWSPLANITRERTSDRKLKETGIVSRVENRSLLEFIRQLAGHGSLSPVVVRWRRRPCSISHCTS